MAVQIALILHLEVRIVIDLIIRNIVKILDIINAPNVALFSNQIIQIQKDV